MLKRTKLTKKDTCLSYVIQRTGTDTSITQLIDLPKTAIKD